MKNIKNSYDSLRQHRQKKKQKKQQELLHIEQAQQKQTVPYRMYKDLLAENGSLQAQVDLLQEALAKYTNLSMNLRVALEYSESEHAVTLQKLLEGKK